MPKSISVNIQIGITGKTSLGLEPGQVVVGSLTVKRMTLDEIKAVDFKNSIGSYGYTKINN